MYSRSNRLLNKSKAAADASEEAVENTSLGYSLEDNRPESLAIKQLVEKVGIHSTQRKVKSDSNGPIQKEGSASFISKEKLNHLTYSGTKNDTTPLQSGPPAQLMWMYRVQDNDKEKKRVMVDDGGNVRIGPGPLNVSAGYPDHALYFLNRGNPYEIDVVEFEVDDEIYYHIIQNMVSQGKGKNSEKPSFNDISKPGFKIEIPDGVYLERFAKGILQGTGKVTRGAEFYDLEAPKMYNEEEVCAMAKAIMEIYADKVTARQVRKIMEKDNGMEFNGRIFSDPNGIVDDWRTVNDALWVVYNKKVNAEL